MDVICLVYPAGEYNLRDAHTEIRTVREKRGPDRWRSVLPEGKAGKADGANDYYCIRRRLPGRGAAACPRGRDLQR